VVQLLLECGADVNAKNNRNWTALHLAACNGCDAVAWLLVEWKTDIEARNSTGQTPGDLAVRNKHETMVQLLLEHGAYIRKPEKMLQ
jgi:ankyrin repeat protein